MVVTASIATPISSLFVGPSKLDLCFKQQKVTCFRPVGVKPLCPHICPFESTRNVAPALRGKHSSLLICAAELNGWCSAEQTQTIVYSELHNGWCSAEQTQTIRHRSSTTTIAPSRGKEKSPLLDYGGAGFPPRYNGIYGGGGGGGDSWAGGFFFFGFLAFLASLQGTGEMRKRTRKKLILQYLQKCKTSLELLFAIWFVMGNVWVFNSRFGWYYHAPKLHVLCISLLAWNAVSYSFPFILFVLLCCCVLLLRSFLGYNMNMASHHRGATEEQLASLPDVGNVLEPGNSAQSIEVQECSICLEKYKEEEENWQLPCTHIFHLKCVDQWLKINSSCPLCRQEIQ